jgi:hypothetical protein
MAMTAWLANVLNSAICFSVSGPGARRDRKPAPQCFGARWIRVGNGHGVHFLAVRERNHDRGVLEEPEPAPHDGVEHRPGIAGRARNDAQDIGGRGLPLERFLGLVEQPHVFDRDHRLVGECLQELDLLL